MSKITPFFAAFLLLLMLAILLGQGYLNYRNFRECRDFGHSVGYCVGIIR